MATNSYYYSGFLRYNQDRGLCGDFWAPSVPITLRVQPLGPTPQRAVSSSLWSFADRTWSQGQLRHLRAIPFEMPPPFHSNSKPISFHLGPSGHFSSDCFKAGLTAIVGASVFGLVLFSSSYSLPSFWVLVLKDLVGLHKTVQLQFLQHYWLGHRLG